VLPEFGGSIARLKKSYAVLAKQAFRPGTDSNHERQARLYLQFCQFHDLQPLDPPVSTMCYYITYLSQRFRSSNSVRNYVSGVKFLHNSSGAKCQALESFPIMCLLRATDTALRAPPHRKAPITPKLLAQLVHLTQDLGFLGPAVKVALLFCFFGMLRMSNIAPSTQHQFDHTRHTSRADVLIRPPGVVLILKWSKTIQDLGATPLIPLPEIPGHPLCPLQAYRELLAASPTTSPRQPLLTATTPAGRQTLTAPLLARLLKDMLNALRQDAGLFSFHSLRRGGATTAYHAGVSVVDVKRHGTWSSDSFWAYVTAPVVASSTVAQALARSVKKNQSH